MNGAEIFKFLCGLKLEFESFEWLENQGLSEFELLISVILTQNTSWNNVLKALDNVRRAQISSIESLNALDTAQIAALIKPSGFYNTKAKRLKGFLNALQKDFEGLTEFKANVSRQWLLSVKGLGFESADSILNYLCQREILVVDSYTQRLALALGYEFESYDELREFFESGIENEQDELNKILHQNAKNSSFYSENSGKFDKNLHTNGENSNQNSNAHSKNSSQNYALYELYQIFHALIIAFGKSYFKGKNLNDEGKRVLAKLRAEI